MTADRLPRRPLRLDRLDAAIVLLAVLLVLGSAAVLAGQWPFPISDAVPLDVAINVAATGVGIAVAILGWVRWRETGQPVALFESSAFVALSTVNALTIGVVLLGRDAEFGLAAADPGPAPIYVWSLTRLTAALLLVDGAVCGLTRRRPRLPPLGLAIGPAILLVAAAVTLLAAGRTLPAIPTPALASAPSVAALGPASAVVFGAQAIVVVLFLVAAGLFRRLYRRDRVVSHAFLSAGLLVAAFSQLHFALDPVVATGVVTSADILRLVFHAILFMGIQAEIEFDLGALRRANVELHRLREVDAANAVLAERARLAREIHDGLAQDLWYAKLKQGRLAGAPELPEAMQAEARDVLHAVDGALAEARQAVLAMRTSPAGAAGLAEVLAGYVEDFGDRFGLRTQFEGTTIPRLPVRTEAELLRIVQEALNNARRHADATLIRVSVDCVDGVARVRVVDNGRGFDPATLPNDRYGVHGMRERAELVGATLTIESRPSDGTRVTVAVAIPGAAPA